MGSWLSSGDVSFHLSRGFRSRPVVRANPTNIWLKCRCESVSGSKSALSFLAVCADVQNCCLPIHFSGSAVRYRLRGRTMQTFPSTACSLRASLVERAGVQMDASLLATQFLFFFVFPSLRATCVRTPFISRFRAKKLTVREEGLSIPPVSSWGVPSLR